MNKNRLFLSLIVVLAAAILSIWIGWYATALGLGVLGTWFGITLWKIARLDAKVLLLLASEVILIWLAFALAYFETTSSISEALSISAQNILHFNFMNISNEMSNSHLYRALAMAEGFVGYLLVVSGIALLISDRLVDKV